jgi:hypothetical protein
MPESATPDPLAAALAAIRGRGYRNGATGALCARLSDAAAEDVPRLLAAVEAVLQLAQRWGPGELDEPYLLDPQTVIRLLRGAISADLLGQDHPEEDGCG